MANVPISRRQFLAASSALAMMGALGAGENLLHAAEDSALDQYALRVDYSERDLGDFHLKTRSYNSTVPGPLMVTRPGHTLRISVTNNLPPDPAATAPPGIDPLNNPHAFNTTNVHVHGLQVIPHLFNPLGSMDPAAPPITISSGQSFTYEFRLPEDHPSGLFWYHPHYHGSTGPQVSNGMAGLILVKGPIDEVPEIAAARDEVLAVQNLKVNPLDPGSRTWGNETLAYVSPDQGGYSPVSKIELLTA